ncbi:MAG: transporter substrate-binding domain-containing protein, partial [Sphingomonadaceae bacterium]
MAADASWLHIYGMEGRPISFLNGNQPDGMVVELAREVQRRIGSKDPIQIIPWARANALAASKQNALLLSIVRTPERDRYLRFVGPVFYSHISAYAVRNRASELRKRDPSLQNL